MRGFTLLEVLVAVVVLSIGLLGLAGLMASSLKNSHSAYQRTQATWLAYDALDRMRANRQVALAGGYNLALSAAPGGSALAKDDLDEWDTALTNTLPAGDGSIAVAAGGVVRIVVQWNDTRGTGGIAAEQFIVDSQL
ncbi:pilus assembly protein PilV [Thiobacillus denitrificans]|uniref:Pilus assembly protein PilV n=2 Tax=Thiobacillus denitrificans TaxID=36861 RepID=A0A106BJ55_THIDE|nr:pilus assembly protein PilV [Thiobacillus denitrificans]